jgi:hypothetical protein
MIQLLNSVQLRNTYQYALEMRRTPRGVADFLERLLTPTQQNEFQSDDAGVRVLAYLCVILPMIAFLSPVTVYYSVFSGRNDASQNAEDEHNDEDALSIPPLPVTSQLLNCFLFGMYAHYTGKWTLLIPNVIGGVLGLVFVALYPFRMSLEFRNQYLWQIGFLVLVGVVAAVALYGYGLPEVPANIGMVIGVIMSCYPLAVMARAVKTRDAAILGSVPMNLAMLGCCASWVVHASAVDFDHAVLTVNVAGVLVQTVALCVHFCLRGKEPQDGSDVNPEPVGAGQDDASERRPFTQE